MAGMGFDAQMLDTTSETPEGQDRLARVRAGCRPASARPADAGADPLDDRPPLRRRARSVLVANVGQLQGGIRLLPDAEPDDGWLDVAVLNPRRLRHWVELGWAVIRRRGQVPRMETFRARRVVVTAAGSSRESSTATSSSPAGSLRAGSGRRRSGCASRSPRTPPTWPSTRRAPESGASS